MEGAEKSGERISKAETATGSLYAARRSSPEEERRVTILNGPPPPSGHLSLTPKWQFPVEGEGGEKGGRRGQVGGFFAPFQIAP